MLICICVILTRILIKPAFVYFLAIRRQCNKLANRLHIVAKREQHHHLFEVVFVAT